MHQLIFKILDRKKSCLGRGKKNMATHKKMSFWSHLQLGMALALNSDQCFEISGTCLQREKSTPYSFLASFSLLKCRMVGVQSASWNRQWKACVGHGAQSMNHRSQRISNVFIEKAAEEMGLPRGYSGKESACQYRKHGFNSWVRTVPWIGNGNPLLYSCQKNSTDRGSWWTTVNGVSKG